MEERVHVGLGPRRYDIVIGDETLDRAGDYLSGVVGGRRAFIVADAHAQEHHGPRLNASLKNAGVDFETLVPPAGEAAKSFAQLERLTGELLDLGVERKDLVIAFGGGVIGDLAGFAASILKRGCRFAQIPTTLLAQVDSAVGGKTAINVPQGKNLVGAFHQPMIVLSDVRVLKTLPPRERRAGYAEIIKYAALGDRRFFDWLEANGAAVVEGDTAATIRAVVRSCQMKAQIVAADERENGERALLNLGHTFAHALEASYGYDGRLLHGEAVAAGMGLAFDYSVRCNRCPAGDAARLKNHLRAAGLPAAISDLPPAPTTAHGLLAAMRHDKKAEKGRIVLVLARGVGKAFVDESVEETDLLTFLEEQIAAGSAAKGSK